MQTVALDQASSQKADMMRQAPPIDAQMLCYLRKRPGRRLAIEHVVFCNSVKVLIWFQC